MLCIASAICLSLPHQGADRKGVHLGNCVHGLAGKLSQVPVQGQLVVQDLIGLNLNVCAHPQGILSTHKLVALIAPTHLFFACPDVLHMRLWTSPDVSAVCISCRRLGPQMSWS